MFYVYIGRLNNIIVYVGTTIQNPEDRFRWHRANGKKLNFSVYKECKDSGEMLDEEFKLIQKFKPRLNKIKDRKQNLNQKLDSAIIESRKGNPEWCQCCLKRRVNKGYKFCFWCSKNK